jgi:hypothetical protein
LRRLLARQGSPNLKIGLWNAFVDSGLLDITEHDCSALPRFLPASYLPVIAGVCRGITRFVLGLLSLPEAELRAVLPRTELRDYLIGELGVLRHRPERLTGCFRFDMAVVGPPGPSNPPKLLEVNDIGFDGLARSSHIQDTLLGLVPGLAARVLCLDTATRDARNMRRLGRRVVRFQYDSYNWEEQVLVQKARAQGVELRMVSPALFGARIHPDCPDLRPEPVTFRAGRLRVGGDPRPPDAFQMGYSFDLGDYQEAPGFFAALIRAETPQYSPFVTALASSKTVLQLLADAGLRRRLLGAREAARLERTILPAWPLRDREDEVRRRAGDYVLKHPDSMGGEGVYVGRELLPQLRRIPSHERTSWVVQQRIRLNTLDVHGILSRPRRVLADLGVFVHYDWVARRLTNFGLSGFISRATNRSLKVNVSGGGIQVPVLFDRAG